MLPLAYSGIHTNALEDFKMTTHRSLVSVLCIFLAAACMATAESAEKIRWTDKFSETTGAATEWTDWFGYTQACGFDFSVDYDDRFTIHVFDDHEIWNIRIRDTYTNLETGFSFEDFSSYNIRYDYQTGLADHRGLFWRIRVPGEGMLILDVGGFLQDWDGDWSILPGSLVGNNHDVNGDIVPPVSYCDLMAEIFPD